MTNYEDDFGLEPWQAIMMRDIRRGTSKTRAAADALAEMDPDLYSPGDDDEETNP
jgi:hypothetical protein